VPNSPESKFAADRLRSLKPARLDPDADHACHHTFDHWRCAGKHPLIGSRPAAKAGFDVQLASGPTTGPEGSLESLDPQLLTISNLVRAVHPIKDFLAFANWSAFFAIPNQTSSIRTAGKAGVLGRLAAAAGRRPNHCPHDSRDPPLEISRARWRISFFARLNDAPHA